MSKELEDIEAKYSTLTVSSEKNGTEYAEVDVEDLAFLIQNGFKQAERVQELEQKLAEIRFVNNDYDKINKRYRAALEEIITLEEYNNMPNFWHDEGDFYDYLENLARKALEEEEK